MVKPTNGKLKPLLEPINTTEIIRDVIQLLRGSAIHKSINYLKTIPPDLIIMG